MAMLDGLRVVFLEALSFADETVIKRLVNQWNEQCEEVYKYKQSLIAEELEKHTRELEKSNEQINRLAVLIAELKADTAIEIFDEIFDALSGKGLTFTDWIELNELKKKYTEGETDGNKTDTEI